jgi:hypothetical protein
MSEPDANMFEVLPGLPGVGPYPEQFSANGKGTHREGFVVRFQPRSSEPWVGNFQPGVYGFTGALPHPEGRTVIVVAGGQAYHVDPETRSLLYQFGGGISGVVQEPSQGLLVFADDLRLWAMSARGVCWETRRISWDGIRGLAVEGDAIVGEAYDPMSDGWCRFAVELETGKVKGGTFRARW